MPEKRARIDCQKAYNERRKASECNDQRAARLAQLSHNRLERVSFETLDERLQLDRN